MSGYYYGDTWIGDENAARLEAMEQRMERADRLNAGLHRLARIVREAAWEDSNNGHSRRYWSLMLRVEEEVFNHLPQNVL